MVEDGKKIATGLGIAAIVTTAIILATRPAKAAPPKDVAATIKIEVIGARHSSPATVTEGESYSVKLTITNQTTSAGIPEEATLTIGIEATVLSEVLIPAQERAEYFSAGQTRSFSYTMNVPPGLGGYSGSIIAAVMDPTGVILAQATEPLVVEALFDPWVYDINGDGYIDKSERVKAANDYYAGIITKSQLEQVLALPSPLIIYDASITIGI